MSDSAAALQPAAQPPVEEYAIQVDNLKKRYGTGDDAVLALRGMSFSIENGEFIAIIGPSGCGKTTLLNILGALDRPTSGKVFIDGVDISQLGNKELAMIRSRKLGFVFQDFNLLSRMSVVENVELPLFIAGADPAFSRRRSMSLLARLGIAHKANKNVNNISGGERQRVAVARALANDPKIVLADEPTGNLDTRNTEMMMGLMRQLNKDFGKTLVIITHNPEVASHAQRVISIRDGSIVEIRRNSRD
jgi:putative ABC transport system ATP-binding protein